MRANPCYEAALEGAKLRLQSDSNDILRVHPRLRTAMDGDGSGAVSRQIMGTTVIGGMLAVSSSASLSFPPCSTYRETWRSRARETGTRSNSPS